MAKNKHHHHRKKEHHHKKHRHKKGDHSPSTKPVVDLEKNTQKTTKEILNLKKRHTYILPLIGFIGLAMFPMGFFTTQLYNNYNGWCKDIFAETYFTNKYLSKKMLFVPFVNIIWFSISCSMNRYNKEPESFILKKIGQFITFFILGFLFFLLSPIIYLPYPDKKLTG
jgi:hypothetical protein